MNKIFVYGTLLKGLERNAALTSSKYLGPALIKARLFDLGSYPGIAEGDADVVGEIYEVDEQTLNNLDAIEGYSESAPESSLYLRKPTSARKLADGSSVDVETYFYSHPNKTIPSSLKHDDSINRFLAFELLEAEEASPKSKE